MDDQSQEFCGLTARLHFEYEYTVPPWKLDQFEIPSGNDVLESHGRRKGRRRDKSANKAKKVDKEGTAKGHKMLPTSHLHRNRYRN